MYDNPTGIRNALMMTPAGQQVVQQYQGGGITQTDVPLADIAGGQGRFFEKFVYPTGIESIENTLGLVPTRPDQRRLPLLPKGSQEDWIQPERGAPYGHSLPSIGGVYSRGATAEEGPDVSQYDVGSVYGPDWGELAKQLGINRALSFVMGPLAALPVGLGIEKYWGGGDPFSIPTTRPQYSDRTTIENMQRQREEEFSPGYGEKSGPGVVSPGYPGSQRFGVPYSGEYGLSVEALEGPESWTGGESHGGHGGEYSSGATAARSGDEDPPEGMSFGPSFSQGGLISLRRT